MWTVAGMADTTLFPAAAPPLSNSSAQGSYFSFNLTNIMSHINIGQSEVCSGAAQGLLCPRLMGGREECVSLHYVYVCVCVV